MKQKVILIDSGRVLNGPRTEHWFITPNFFKYVDDSIKNCDGAKELGIQSFLLCRDTEKYNRCKCTCKNHPVINSLSDLLRKIS